MTAPYGALFGGSQIRLQELQTWAGQTERAHGWAGGEDVVDIPAKLCLIHSEVSEALEEYRHATTDWSAFASELADIVIRVAGLAESLDIDLAAECVAKQHYNDTRPYKHGGKRI